MRRRFLERIGKSSQALTQRATSKQDPSTNSVQREARNEEDELPDGEGDFWSTASDYVQCRHVSPRKRCCVPQEEAFPVPLKFVGVLFQTQIDLESAEERTLNNNWSAGGTITLSDDWWVGLVFKFSERDFLLDPKKGERSPNTDTRTDSV